MITRRVLKNDDICKRQNCCHVDVTTDPVCPSNVRCFMVCEELSMSHCNKNDFCYDCLAAKVVSNDCPYYLEHVISRKVKLCKTAG